MKKDKDYDFLCAKFKTNLCVKRKFNIPNVNIEIDIESVDNYHRLNVGDFLKILESISPMTEKEFYSVENLSRGYMKEKSQHN
jgi:hypothetical protein